MNTYLVTLECLFPEKHRALDLNLIVSVIAESAEQVEAPLRQIVIKEQAKRGFNEVYVHQIVPAPTEMGIVMAFENGKNTTTLMLPDDWDLKPAWLRALGGQERSKLLAEYYGAIEAHRAPAYEPDERREWDDAEPFMEFANAVVAPENLVRHLAAKRAVSG